MSQNPADGLSFILPISNHGEVLEKGIREWLKVLDDLHRPIQILIVDDGSTDKTKSILDSTSIREAKGKNFKELTILSNPSPLGYGASLRLALPQTNLPLVFYTSLDYPYQPEDIRELIKRLEEKDPESDIQLHLVNGYRARKPVPPLRARLGKCWRFLLRIGINVPSEPLPGWLGKEAHRYQRWVRMMFGLRIIDLNSKFKLFRRDIFRRIPIQSDGEAVHAEILAKANFLSCYMDEIPIAKGSGVFRKDDASGKIPDNIWKELKVVFHQPDFGPWPPSEVIPPLPKGFPKQELPNSDQPTPVPETV
jgi:glycosyltransferase involved in cell wall biosynthesis